ncbi:MAG: hypothetical protein LBP20_01560 [Treponema sp.]|nr:hypothetical protein [Treponema sp.]
MKKMLGCILMAIVLVGCKTLETYITDVDAYYEPIEINIPGNALFTFDKSGIHTHFEILDKNFKKRTLVMNEYYLIEDSQIYDFSGVPPKGSSGVYHISVGGEYSFLKESVCLGQFEIVTESTITVFSNDSSIGSSQKYIRIKDENGIIKREIKPNEINSDIYINIYDDEIGRVGIEKYESRSANQPSDSPWKYYTGFIIRINSEEYGILAFYPKPKFYKKIEFFSDMDEEKEDKIVLYMFIGYESFNRNDDIFTNQQ